MSRSLLASTLVFAGYLLALGAAAYWLPPDKALPNVAAKLGYNIGLAYNLTLLWTLFALATLAWLGRGPRASDAKSEAHPAAALGPLTRSLEPLAAFMLFALLYWPAFLARYGDFIEDKYFLSALWRMDCGEQPYRDFEFFYGPLMIYPAHYWNQMFGFSLASYYGLLALLQGAFFATLVLVLQRYLPERRARYLAFLLLVPFFVDILLGFNYLAWRRMLPVFALLLVAARPLHRPTILAAAALLGLELAYSFEFGLAGLAACGAVYGLLLAGPERSKAVAAGAALAAGSLVIGVLLVAALTGSIFPDYFRATAHVLDQAGRLGLGAFAFYFTAHSLALFGVLAISVVVLGTNLTRLRREAPAEGDSLLAGALVYAVLALKIALQRADVWHMVTPFVALAAALLLAPQARVFVFPRAMKRAALGLLAIAAVTTLLGYFPKGIDYVRVLKKGARDVLSGTPAAGPIASRSPSVQAERTEHDPDLAALAGYLAAPENRDRPVMFHKGRWWTAHHLGVCPIGYSFYDVLYSDERRPLRATLAQNPGAFVVLEQSSYDALLGRERERRRRSPRLTERLGALFSSVHYHQSQMEEALEVAMWERSVGDVLREDFVLAAQFGSTVVLAQRGSVPP